MSRGPSSDCNSARNAAAGTGVSNQDRDLHGQIEDLLTALSDMQREQGLLAGELQKEREEREEDRAAVQCFLDQTTKTRVLDTINESEDHERTAPRASLQSEPIMEEESQSITELRTRFGDAVNKKRSSLMQQTKHEMRDELRLWKEQYEVEAARSADLSNRVAGESEEKARYEQQCTEMQAKLQEADQEKSQLQQTIAELKIRRYSTESDFESVPQTPADNAPIDPSPREPIMNRTGSLKGNAIPAADFAKRSSSLGMARVLSTENHRPPSEESMLLELVNAKTAEAVARQELEEVKNKLDSLRKMLGNGPSSGPSGHRPTPSESTITARSPPDLPKPNPPGSNLGGGGFFSGWGKRAASNPAVTVTVATES